MEQTEVERPARRFKFRHGIVSDVGLKREENQDSYGYAHTSNVSIYLVCDGMGGARGGATASALAVDTILRSCFNEFGLITELSLKEALQYANGVIFERSQQDESLVGMGTTAVALAYVGNDAIIGHVGDSRAYRLHRGEIQQLTKDHTLVQELVDSGAITPDEAANHPISHMLTRSLGPSGVVESAVSTLSIPVEEGDKFLLCCDGLYNLVTEAEMREVLTANTPEESTKTLLDMALQRGAPDNVTIQVLEARDVADTTVDVKIPDEGKIRVVTSPSVENLTKVEQPAPPPPPPPPVQERPSAPTSSNPMDSIVFGNNPTTAELQQQMEEAKRRKAEHEQMGGAAQEEPQEKGPDTGSQVAEEKVADEVEQPAAEQKDEQPELAEKDLRTLMIAAGVIVIVVLLVLIFIVLSRSKKPSTVPSQAEPQVTAVQPPVLPELPDVVPTAAPQRILTPEVVATPLATQSAEPPAPVVAPSVEPTFELPKAAWPTLNIIPEDVVPSEGVLPTKVDDRIKQYESVINRARELAVKTSPPVSSIKSEGNDLEPIDWEREKEVAQQIVGQNTLLTTNPSLLTAEEKERLTDRKSEIRESLTDTDAKIELLAASASKDVQGIVARLKQTLDDAQKAADYLQERMGEVKQQYVGWKERSNILTDRDALRLADELALKDNEVKRLRDEYQKVKADYQAALAVYQQNPRDTANVPALTALGREMKSKRGELERSVAPAVERGLSTAEAELRDIAYAFTQIEKLIQRMNRHQGYAQAVLPNIDGRNNQLLKNLFDERKQFYQQYVELLAQLPDEIEQSVMADRAVVKLSLSPTVNRSSF